jgi:putative transposase
VFTFTRFPFGLIERLHEEFKRRIKTQTIPPCAETAAMPFWALLASARSSCERSTDWG